MTRVRMQLDADPAFNQRVRMPADLSSASRQAMLAVTVLVVTLIWSCWETVAGLWADWQADPNYSVGQLVPLVVLYLVWNERKMLRRCRITPCWWGVGLLLLGQVARFAGLLLFYESAERYALVVTAAGLVLLIAGRQVFWRLRWVLVFTLLMVPLPGRIHNALSGPLQGWATSSTVFVLEVFGANVSSEGNILVLGDAASVGIAEACSGLRMLTAFVVVAAVFALLVDRPRWQKAALVASSIPIALLCNVMRLVITVVLYAHTSSKLAELFFHDFAGVTMMPIAVAILMGELWLMKQLIVPEQGAAQRAAKV